jgi:hypothetical protein
MSVERHALNVVSLVGRPSRPPGREPLDTASPDVLDSSVTRLARRGGFAGGIDASNLFAAVRPSGGPRCGDRLRAHAFQVP